LRRRLRRRQREPVTSANTKDVPEARSCRVAADRGPEASCAARDERTHGAAGRGAEHLRRPELHCPCLRRQASCLERRSLWSFRTIASRPEKPGKRRREWAPLQNKTPEAHECRHTPTPAAAKRGRPAGEEGGSLKRPDDEPEGSAAAPDAPAAAGAADARPPTQRRERLEAAATWRSATSRRAQDGRLATAPRTATARATARCLRGRFSFNGVSRTPPPPAGSVTERSFAGQLGGLRLTRQRNDARTWQAASLPLFEQHPQQAKHRHDHHRHQRPPWWRGGFFDRRRFGFARLDRVRCFRRWHRFR